MEFGDRRWPAAVYELPLLPTVGEVGILRRLEQSTLIRDTNDRPLCEGKARNAPPPSWWDGDRASTTEARVPMRYARCPYDDPRRHQSKRMNASAVENIATHWDGVIALMTWFARAHEHMPTAVDSASAAAFYQRTKLVLAAPLCAFVRTPGRRIDPVIAGAWKASLGFAAVAQRMLIDGVFGDPIYPVGSDIYNVAVRSGALIGRGEVCAGSPKMIAATADALLGRLEVEQDRIEGATRIADLLGDPARWLPAGALYSNHWFYDQAVVLVAAMLEEDERAARERERRYPIAPADRSLLVEALRDQCIDVLGEAGRWSALLDCLAHCDEESPRGGMHALREVQQRASREMEGELRSQLQLPPLDPGAAKSTCFADLRPTDSATLGVATRLRGLANAMRIEDRLRQDVQSLAGNLDRGGSTQPAWDTARLLAAHVRFAREVAQIGGSPVETDAADRLRDDAVSSIKALAESIPFAPTRDRLERLAAELCAESDHVDDAARALPGDPAAWMPWLEPFVGVTGLRVLDHTTDHDHLLAWIATRVAPHASARLEDVGDAAPYDLAVVAGCESTDEVIASASACWSRIRDDGGLLIVFPPRVQSTELACPFQPSGARPRWIGGAWIISRTAAVRVRREPRVVRDCHGDRPFNGITFRVEAAE